MPRVPAMLAAIVAITATATTTLEAQRLGPPMSAGSLRLRLEAFAHDSMKGRETGTPEHVKATRFIAEEMRKLGLRPQGDDGSFLQKVPLVRTVLDTAATTLTVAGQRQRPYVDYLPRNQGASARPFDGVPVVYAGVWGTPSMLRGDAVRGKVVLLGLQPDSFSVIKLAAQAAFAEANAIVIANFDLMPPSLRDALAASPMVLDQPAEGPALPAYMHIPVATAARMLGVANLAEAQPGATATPLGGRIAFRTIGTEAYNVVAVLPGSDPALRDEYVAVGAHSDHVGTTPRPQDKDSTRAFNLELRRKQLANNGLITQAIFESIRVNMDSIRRVHPTPRLDSIYNGADDDGSGSMGLLEVARALAGDRQKPKRSILFVWHVGEEMGLFGSEYFTDHPTVPRESIVAQVNIDMIGRGRAGEEVDGGPDYLQLIGSRRLSTQLGDLVEKVNVDGKFGWAFDYQYDAPGHPEQYYCRSDHYMYARYGIPVVFMTTGGHADYHEVTDEVEHIDFEKLAKVSRFVRDLARAVGDLPQRPVVDKPKPDPHGQCVQ